MVGAGGVQAGDEDGRASLHKAAYAGHAAICQLLIDNGADVNATHAPPPQPKPQCRRGH